MKRSPLRRKTPLGTAAPLTTGRRRKAKETIRIYGGKERLGWLHALPCIITGRYGVECVHVKGGGVSRKADAKWTVPMHPTLHRLLHQCGIRTFGALYDIDLNLAAIATEQQWQAYLARTR